MTAIKKNCKFCDKQGVWIYPLRYAVAVAANPANLQALPGALPSSLGQNVTDIALSANARYTARVSRGGYIYALIERSGVRYWQAYLVVEDSLLYQFDSENPPRQTVEFSCERTSCGIDASVISINEVSDVSAVWLMFSPSALTKAKLDEYKKNADAYAGMGKMQVFDVKAWSTTGTFQTHMLTPDHLKTNVPEFVLHAQGKDALTSPLGLVMKAQMFPAINAAYAGTPPKADGGENGYLGVLAQRLKAQKAMVCVLFDHIGIAQELNDFRNAPMAGIEHYLATVDKYGASNLQRLQVYEAIREIEKGMKTGLITSTQKFQDDHRQWSDGRMNQQLEFAKRLRADGRVEDAISIEKDVENKRVVREQNYNQHLEAAKRDAQENWAKDYASRLDLDEMALFDRVLKKHTQAASDAAAARAGDHLKWFEADRLVNTFEMFDPANAPSGYDFAVQSAICTYGLSGCKAGEEKIDSWLRAPEVERKNLYFRGVYYNQESLFAHVKDVNRQIKEAVAQVDQASGLTTAVMLKATKGLVDGFKKVDSAFDEWARNQTQDFSKQWVKSLEVVLYHKAADMTRAVFRAGLGGVFDKGLTASLSGLLYARLRATVGTLAYEELMLSIPKEKVAANAKARAERRAEGRRADKAAAGAAKVADQVDGSLENLVADAQEKARAKVQLSLKEIEGNKSLPTNNYHQARIGVLLGCIEMIALGDKVAHFEPGTKGYLEVTGSAMAVAGIVMDTFYSATKSVREIQPYTDINAINKGADIVRGGFKLWAGALGGAAGLCSAILDTMKIFDKKTDRALAVIYGARALTGFVSAGLTMAAAFSYAKPFLGHFAKRFAEHSLRYRALTTLAGWAGRLAMRVRLLVWVARINLIGLIWTGLEIGYLLLKDDDLQNWCEKCVFRKVKTSSNWLGRQVTEDYFSGGSVQELTALEEAAQAVGVGG